MVVAGDFKNGVTFEMDGNVLQVIEFQHVKPAKAPLLCGQSFAMSFQVRS